MPLDFQVINLNEVCLICMKKAMKLQPIFSQNPLKNGLTLSDLITECLSIQIMNSDEFPSNICQKCVQKLSSFYQFKVQSHLNLEELQRYLESNGSLNSEILPSSVNEEVDEILKTEGAVNDLNSEDSKVIVDSAIAQINEELISKTKLKTEELINSTDDNASDIGENKKTKRIASNKKKNHRIQAPVPCPICGKMISSKSNLRHHLQFHSGTKPLKCEFCPKNFSFSSELARHIRVHTGEKPFKCTFCEKSFSDGGVLARHNRIHTGDRPNLCNTCGKSFTLISQLRSHNRVHTGEKPYKCPVDKCEKRFSSASNLQIHKVTHFDIKRHRCPYCNKYFKSKSQLNAHRKFHEDKREHACNLCHHKFNLKSQLTQHMISHTNNQSYECVLCPATFKYRNGYVRHIQKNHQKQIDAVKYKNVNCDQCMKKFLNETQLQEHILKDHDPDLI